MNKFLYSTKSKVLTLEGFKNINQLTNDDKLVLLNDKTNKLELVSNYKVTTNKHSLSCFGVNRRSIITTKDAANKSFFSLDYELTDIDGSYIISVDIDEERYELTVSQYILLGYLLFNFFEYNELTKEFKFNPPISNIKRLSLDLSKVLDELPIDISNYINNFEDNGDIFILKSDSFSKGVNTYIEYLIHHLLKGEDILKPFIDANIIYCYNNGDITDYYINVKDILLGEFLCFMFNIYYGGGLLKSKKGMDIIFISEATCYKNDKDKYIQRFMNNSGNMECFSIEIESNKDYFIPTSLSLYGIVNSIFVPVYVNNSTSNDPYGYRYIRKSKYSKNV